MPTAPAFLSVGFSPGRRPRAGDIVALARREGTFEVSHQPPEEEGWIELLVNGLTFDLTGLASGPPAEPPLVRFRFGIREARPTEAVALAPGPHIAAGRTLPPVSRAAASLAVGLCRLEGAEIVSWHAAQNAIARDVFAETVATWLAGGVFPAMVLTSLDTSTEGRMCSEGLRLFIGQELRLDSGDASPVEAAKLASRLIDRLVCNGRLSKPVTWKTDDGGSVRLEPIGRGDIVRAWRQSA